MASKGKKGGKPKKGQTLNLNDFLGGPGGGGGSYRPPGAGATTTVEVGSTWAEEMDEEGYEDNRPKQQIVLPTAPRAALGPDIDDDRIPKRPPYTAYIANLPYDVDEEQVKEVFVRARLKITQVRLMKEEGGRLRGYGYADFEDRDSLVDVLTMSDLAVNNRKIRVDLASQSGKQGGGGGGFGDRDDRDDRRREEDPNAGRSDADTEWRRGPAPAPRDDDRRGGRDSSDRDRYGGRDSYDRDRGGSRGFSNYEAPRDSGGRDRDGGRYGGFSRDRDGGDRGGFDRGGSGYRDRGSEREAPKERPKLQLAARSKPKEDEGGSTAQSSIFGGAKPVDTIAKEKELEERAAKERDAKEEAKKNKPSAASIFGGAKPVDTTQREKEIEQKLSKLTVKPDESKEEEKKPIENAWRSRTAREGGEEGRSGGGTWGKGEERRGDYDRDRRDERGGTDRGYDRGGSDRRGGGYDDRRGGSGYDRDRRDDRGSSGYDRDRRDDRGSSGYDRDRRDDRGSSGYDRDRRDDRGSSSGYDRDRRDDRGYDRDRRDDRGYDRDRRDDGKSGKYEESSRRDEDRPAYGGRDSRDGGEDKNGVEKKDEKEPQMKKYEEPEPPVVVATNKFAFLSEEEEEGSGGEKE